MNLLYEIYKNFISEVKQERIDKTHLTSNNSNYE